ncbi:sensor histidine kinase [Actinomadura rupiterrae]|uniref:sensor histidine kinase n=1 Tax=Actinomadura rupiterrae TaxID=559627 RepID=UPI0020A6180D|nr:HAMP domain-containing sensor histidine kinase [Actinomadura rupiterrae]MCP2338979.1 signal transduction histidine kinase [Actinomadura rupiterrae]
MRNTVRLRLTLLYGAMFTCSGAALIAVVYLLMWHGVLGPNLVPRKAAGGAPHVSTLSPSAAQALHQQRAVLMHQLLVRSLVALAGMAVASVALGWVVAGRALRPVRTITAAAREISATSLHRRLAMVGPNDELKELGDTFDALLNRLESAFGAQRMFVANASHELRTPLTRQRLLSQDVLSDPDATNAELRAAHERVLVAGAQQERLIEALLTLARAHAGLDVREPFDLAPLVRGAAGRQTAVVLDLAAAPTTGHAPLAERLIANLLDNAVRYNVPGGYVHATTRTEGDRAVLVVANSGPHVPDDEVGLLFEPFRRSTAGRLARRDGLGLGLSIVAAIAEAHDACVTARPGPEGGLVVRVAFPLAATGV